MLHKHGNVIKIRAHGFGFIFSVLLCLFFIIGSIICLCLIDFKSWINIQNRTAEAIILIIGLIASIPLWSYELYIFFKKGVVIFRDDEFITDGRYTKSFPPIKRKCEDFLNFKLTSKYLATSIEFTFNDGKKIHFNIIQFTKNQSLQILREIQKRGGFPDQEIKFERYYI